MTIIQLIMCDKEEFESMPTSDNIIIQVGMKIDGQVFTDAMIIDDYKNTPIKDVINEIEECGKLLLRRYGGVLAAKDSLNK